MARTTPSVSIVITCYNFRAFIERTLESVASQSHGDFEAIVVDNGSTDGSDGIIAAFAARDSRFVAFGESRQGVHHALNAGLARASGDLVLLLDGDDLYEPERVARTVAHFETTQSDLIACNGCRIDGCGALDGPYESYFHSAAAVPFVVCEHNPIWTVSFLALSRRALAAVGELPGAANLILDWHLVMRCCELGLTVTFLDEPLALKRDHGGNTGLDVETTERQAVARLAQFMASHPVLREHLTPEDRRRLLTRRYLRAFEHMRRHRRWSALIDYLVDQIAADRIREVVHRFGVAVAWYHLDRSRFVMVAGSYESSHPLWLFIRGLARLEEGRGGEAARLFELAYVKTLGRFGEAMNSWAVAVASVDPDKSRVLLEQAIQANPYYRDPRVNLSFLRQGRHGHLRHTVSLIPETLAWLADWQ